MIDGGGPAFETIDSSRIPDNIARVELIESTAWNRPP